MREKEEGGGRKERAGERSDSHVCGRRVTKNIYWKVLVVRGRREGEGG
jgi:hypothetical protein